MSVFDKIEPRQPSPEQGAERIRQTLQGVFQQIEGSLEQVRRICERHGRGEIKSALGSDDGEVVKLYQALKKLVEQQKPGTKIDDLPG